MGISCSAAKEKIDQARTKATDRKPPQPVVKWAGGKRWLASRVAKLKPKKWQGRYYEPFVGGGALFFALQPKRATLSDTNEELIATYTAIRNNPERLIDLLSSYSHGELFFTNYGIVLLVLNGQRLLAFYILTILAGMGSIAYILEELRGDGVGLLIIDDDGYISESIRARNSALVVTADPTLKYGNCKADVISAMSKFNDVNRKDGLRDMCELVERETEQLAVLAVRRTLLVMNEQTIRAQDWSTQIDTLASKNAYNSGHSPIIDVTFKNDLHSFRGARNLVDHPVKNKRDDSRRQKQFAERMVQGPRLVAELVSLKRRIQ